MPALITSTAFLFPLEMIAARAKCYHFLFFLFILKEQRPRRKLKHLTGVFGSLTPTNNVTLSLSQERTYVYRAGLALLRSSQNNQTSKKQRAPTKLSEVIT